MPTKTATILLVTSLAACEPSVPLYTRDAVLIEADGAAATVSGAVADARAAAEPPRQREPAEDAASTPIAPEPDDDGGARDDAGDAERVPLDVPGPAVSGVRLAALRGWTPVRREPRRDGPLSGYLRTGAVVDVVSGPHGSDGCIVNRGSTGGWYFIAGGGFVCVGGSHTALLPVRDFRTPTQPDLDASMPYHYAVSYGRSNMYRRMPTVAELRLYEPWRVRTDQGDGGMDAASPEAPEAGALAAVRDVPRPTLGELEGDPTSPVIRRMLTGMYVALDRTVRDSARGDRYWITQSGGLVRDNRLSELGDPPRFQGVALDEAHHLPMAWMVSEVGALYSVSPEGRVSRGRRAPRHTTIALTDGPMLTQAGRSYYPTLDGGAVFVNNVRHAVLRAPPDDARPDERWIDVDLDEQVLVAYEGAKPVYTTLISSGRRTSRNAPERFETPEGTFHVQSKHISTTMDGDTVTDGPYSIEDVPWVMYFQGSYALHAAFWHGYFGWRMSHGCVNLSPPDARWMFLWSEPRIPAGWHGVNAEPARPGSRVIVRHSRQNQNIEAGRPAGAATAVTLPTTPNPPATP